ncbi:MAG TPA: hypothetical protein VGL80_09750 [Pseudonocardiaceae bacterium]|jgi:hypothetical protein
MMKDSYFMAGQPPTRVIADAAVRGSGPIETGRATPTSAGWRELADARSTHLGTLDAAGFLRLLPDDAIVTGTAVVPAIVAGADLAVFPLGLFGMYLNRPGMPDIWTPAGAPPGWGTT